MPINTKILARAMKDVSTLYGPNYYNANAVALAYEKYELQHTKMVEAAMYWIRNTLGLRIARENSDCVKMMVMLTGCDVKDAVDAMQEAINIEMDLDAENDDLPF